MILAIILSKLIGIYLLTPNFIKKEQAFKIEYRKVTSFNMSRLEAHAGVLRFLMKGIFNPYVPTVTFSQKLIS